MTIETNMKTAFEFAKAVIANPDAYPDKMLVIPFDPKLIASLFTEERLKLWRLVQKTKVTSITQLAGKVGRDVSRVRQDLLILERNGMVEMTRETNRVCVHATAQKLVIAVQ